MSTVMPRLKGPMQNTANALPAMSRVPEPA